MKTLKSKKNLRESLRLLMESDLDASEIVMAAQAMSDEVQAMVEKSAKLFGDTVIPMLDKIKDVMGPDVSQRFQNASEQALSDLTKKLMASKTALDGAVDTLNRAANGDSTTDMAMDGAAPDMGGDMPDMADGQAVDGPPAPPADLDAAPTDAKGASDLDMDEFEPVSDDEFGPAGRPKKESATVRGRRLAENNAKVKRNVIRLRESKSPDRLVLASFRKLVREGVKAASALVITSRSYGIDASDVMALVREAKAEADDRKACAVCPPKKTAGQGKKPFGKKPFGKKPVDEDMNIGSAGSDKPQAAYSAKNAPNPTNKTAPAAPGSNDDMEDTNEDAPATKPAATGQSNSTKKPSGTGVKKPAPSNAPAGGPLNPRGAEPMREGKKGVRPAVKKPGSRK